MKKTVVLLVLFVLPIVAYLFFASGVNNFGRLPVLTEGVIELPASTNDTRFQGRITVLGFLGANTEGRKGNAFNLNQKIYKRFYEFNDFQFVMLVPKGAEEDAEGLKKELSNLADTQKWLFVYQDPETITAIFNSLGTDLKLEADYGSPYVFIVDKDRNLRGRKLDEEGGTKFGFNSTSVADLNNKMEDDIKIILAEYRLALKKNNANRAK